MTPSITQINVFTALRTFILSVVPSGVEVIRTQTNRVAMPKGDFVAMTPGSQVPLETNTDTWNTLGNTKSISRPMQYTIQIDCYGSSASDNAAMISALFRDDFAVQSFIASGFDIAPLYAEDASQMPLVTGEEQYFERWTFNCLVQVNPVVSTPIQTANQLVPNVINVERVYPL